MIKSIAAKLPVRVQQELKRWHHGQQIKSGRFNGGEPEVNRLGEWLSAGDWCLDIGANVGHYARSMSDLVGAGGRVIAFEPVSHTFELLAANASRFEHHNVTLINAAASNVCGIVSMGMPSFESGLDNFYRARIGEGGIQAMALSIDSLNIQNRIALIKIDVEGHELFAIQGAIELIKRDRPVLIVEDEDIQVEKLLRGLGYRYAKDTESPNRVYQVN